MAELVQDRLTNSLPDVSAKHFNIRALHFSKNICNFCLLQDRKHIFEDLGNSGGDICGKSPNGLPN